MITLASREFRVLLPVLPASLRCLRIFGFVSVAWCCIPTFIAYPHGLPSWGIFIGFLAFVVFGPVLLGSVCADYADDSIADSGGCLA